MSRFTSSRPHDTSCHRRITSVEGGGFTLVELLVCIAIIGVLVSLALPALSRARAGGMNALCLAKLKQLGVGFQMYINDNKSWFPDADMDSTTENTAWDFQVAYYMNYSAPGSNRSQWGPPVYYCPAAIINPVHKAAGASRSYAMNLYVARRDDGGSTVSREVNGSIARVRQDSMQLVLVDLHVDTYETGYNTSHAVGASPKGSPYIGTTANAAKFIPKRHLSHGANYLRKDGSAASVGSLGTHGAGTDPIWFFSKHAVSGKISYQQDNQLKPQ